MRTPRWVDQALAMSCGLLQVVGVVSLIGAMVALEFLIEEPASPNPRPDPLPKGEGDSP